MPVVLPAFSTLVTDARYCHVRQVRKSSGVLAACAGVERCRPDYHVRRSGFECMGLEFVASGGGAVTLDRRRSVLGPGTAFLYGPGIPHEIATLPSRPMVKYFVDFYGAGTESFLRRLGLSTGQLRQVVEVAAVQALFEGLLADGQRGGERVGEIADAYLRLILHKVAETPAGAPVSLHAGYSSWRRCEAVLEADFRSLKGLGELSARTGLHQSHLCRLYKQFGRGSPHAELTRRKMNHAAMLLVTSNLLVKEVAAQVGYDDPLHFSRVFRRQFGRSPLEFRQAESRAGH